MMKYEIRKNKFSRPFFLETLELLRKFGHIYGNSFNLYVTEPKPSLLFSLD